MSFITGVGLTAFGRHEGSSTLDLMSKAAGLAIADAGLKRSEVDGVLCGYSTVAPHIMLATVFAEHFGIRPTYAHAVQVGGATGLAMTMLAHHLVEAGVVRHVLVVSGENRLTGQSRDASILALAQVGHPDYEGPLGPTIPAYYGLVASRYMHEYGVTEEDLAEFAVLMRKHAVTHPGAQFHDPITVTDVMESKAGAAVTCWWVCACAQPSTRTPVSPVRSHLAGACNISVAASVGFAARRTLLISAPAVRARSMPLRWSSAPPRRRRVRTPLQHRSRRYP